MTVRFKVARRAESQIREAAEWWLENRREASNMFAEDLESAFALLSEFPRAGEAVRHRRIPTLRRILLSRVQFHLYYAVAADASAVEVLALWHASRGAKPPI